MLIFTICTLAYHDVMLFEHWCMIGQRSATSNFLYQLPHKSATLEVGDDTTTGSCVVPATGHWLSNVNFSDVFICILTEWKMLHCMELYNISYVYTEHFIQ